MGIIDSGCQVVIIRMTYGKNWHTNEARASDVLGVSQCQANTTMGTIPSICFLVSEVSLYCLVQVVKNALLNVLLKPALHIPASHPGVPGLDVQISCH